MRNRHARGEHAAVAHRNMERLVDVQTHQSQQVPVLLCHAVHQRVAQQNLRLSPTCRAYSVSRAEARAVRRRGECDVAARHVHHQIGKEPVEVRLHLRSDRRLICCDDRVGLRVRREASTYLGEDARALEGPERREEPDDLGVH